MTMLDDRGREAARAIHDSVSGYRPVVAAVPLLARRKAIWQGAQLAAGAVAVAALIAAVALVTDPDDRDVAETTTIPESAVTTTVPSPPTTDAPESLSVPATTVATSPTITVPPTTIADTTPPPLSIISPEPEAHFETEVVTFRGTTEPGASVVAASKFGVDVDAAGNWSIDLVLAPGKNGASFTATDAAGNQARASIVVWLDVPEEPKEAPVKDFTAYATFGSCSETPPYDVYYGTAAPGTIVTISSAYGSGSASADAEGHWEKKVHFESAPYGVMFVVTVADHTGKTQSFEFVSYATS